MSIIRDKAEYVIAQREAVPGMPSEGPYPATVEEVADELVAFIRELDTTCARGVAAIIRAQLST
jgi:hypothetical protein